MNSTKSSSTIVIFAGAFIVIFSLLLFGCMLYNDHAERQKQIKLKQLEVEETKLHEAEETKRTKERTHWLEKMIPWGQYGDDGEPKEENPSR